MHTLTPEKAAAPTALVLDAKFSLAEDVINGAFQLALSSRHPVNGS